MKRIGDILKRNKTPVIVNDQISYKQVTIRTNYKGVCLRGMQSGSAIGTKNQFAVSSGQFILSRIDARNGAFGIIPDELEGAIVTNDFLAFDINQDEVEIEFFNVLLQSPVFLEACIRASRGNTNRKRVDEKFFLNYEVNLPDHCEQQRLIKRVNGCRTAIAAAQHEISWQKSLLTRLKQAILREAVTGKLTAGWRAIHSDVETAGSLLKRIQSAKSRIVEDKKLRSEKLFSKIADAEILFEIPSGWEWCRAGDIGIVIGGLTKNAAKRDGHSRILPYLRVANVYANRLDLSDIQKIGVAESEVDKLLLEKSDLLVVEGNGSYDQVGRIALWDGSVDPCVHQNHLIKIRLGEPKVASWALYWFLSPPGRLLIENQARTSTGLYNLSTGKVANLPIPLPPLDEQLAIVTRVEMLLQHYEKLAAEVERTQYLTSRLLNAVLKDAFAATSDSERDSLTSQSKAFERLSAEFPVLGTTQFPGLKTT